MGYRSDVAIAIYGPEDRLAPLIAAQRILPKSALVVDAQYVRQGSFTMKGPADGETKFMLLEARFDCVKWYSGYEDVARWTDFLAAAQDIEDVSTEFVRIGEENDDIEYVGTGDFCEGFLGVSREIVSRFDEVVELPNG